MKAEFCSMCLQEVKKMEVCDRHFSFLARRTVAVSRLLKG
jgi:hypothetical protein